MSVIMRDKYVEPLRCKHCGGWHFGRSWIDSNMAMQLAIREREQCRRGRERDGLEDKLTEAEATW